MKKLFLFMSWVMLILSGCADEDIIERNSPSFPQSVNTRSAGDGVYDILGYGYDITGPYLDTIRKRTDYPLQTRRISVPLLFRERCH